MYDGGRYFTVTGRQIEGSSDEIAEGTDTLAWIHETYLQKQKKGKEKKAKAARKAEPLTDEEVLEKASPLGMLPTYEMIVTRRRTRWAFLLNIIPRLYGQATG